MKILFVEPPIDYPNSIINTGVHLGVLTIIPYLRDNGIQAEFRFISEQIELANGSSQSSLIECLATWVPNVVCISAITGQYPRAVSIAQAAKQSGAVVIMGNIYPSLNAEEIIMKDTNVDIVVRGEGEAVLLEFFNHMIRGTDWRKSNGITYRLGDEIISTPPSAAIDLTKLPLPSYELLPIDVCRKLNLYGSVETARGCPYSCSFCTLIEDIWPGYRLKAIEQVVSECQALKDLGFHQVRITDDTFTVNRNRILTLCKELQNARLGLKFRVLTRVDLLDDELLDNMLLAGVNGILFGAEQIDRENLSAMNKTHAGSDWAETTKQAIKMVAESGCIANPVFMLGWPGDTAEKMKRLVRFAVDVGRSPFVQPFVAFTTPHPGSELWRHREALGLKVITSDLSKFIHLYPVAIPLSLGDNALELLIEAHNVIRVETGVAARNPVIGLGFVQSYSDLL